MVSGWLQEDHEDAAGLADPSEDPQRAEEPQVPASMKGLTQAQYEEALKARAEAGLPPPELTSARARDTTAPTATRNADRRQAAAQSSALVSALQRQNEMGHSAEVVLKAKAHKSGTGGRNTRGKQVAKGNNRTSSPRRAGSAVKQRPKGSPRAKPEEGEYVRKEATGYSPPKGRKLSAQQIGSLVDRLNQTPKRERVRMMTLKAQDEGFMESMASETHESVASTSSKKKVSKGEERVRGHL